MDGVVACGGGVVSTKLIAEFLRREDIYHRFQYFLEVKNIKPSQADKIIDSLTSDKVVELTAEEEVDLMLALSEKPIFEVE